MISGADRVNTLDKLQSCRDAMMNFVAIRCLVPLVFILIGVPFTADGADPKSEYPSIVITVPSIDRVLDRGVLMTESAGRPVSKERLLSRLPASGNRPPLDGINVDKPLAMILFSPIEDVLPGEAAAGDDDSSLPKKKTDCDLKDDDTPANPEGRSPTKPDDGSSGEPEEDKVETRVSSKELFDRIMDRAGATPADSEMDAFDRVLDRIGLEWTSTFDRIDDFERFVLIIPITDFDRAMTYFGAVAVADQPDRFILDDGQEFTARRIGDYLVCGNNPDRVAICSDLQAVAPTLVESNDLVITLKSMPADARAKRAAALQRDLTTLMRYDDDESPGLNAIVKAATAVFTEWIDLTALQVDEIRVSLRIDPERKQIISELDVVGPNNGKLAQAANDWAPTRRFIQGIEDPNGPITFHFAFQIPARHSKAIAESMANFAENPEGDVMIQAVWYFMSPLVRATIALIKSGDFELFCTCIESNERWVPMLGLKFPGGAKFPTALQSLLLTLSAEEWIEMNKDAVNAVPVHKVLFEELADTFAALGTFDQWCWLSATAEVFWLSAMLPDDLAIPDRLKTAIQQTSSKLKKAPPVEHSDHAIFRLSLHMRHFIGLGIDSPQADGDAAKTVQTDSATDQNTGTQKSPFREKSDGVIAELNPSPTGFHLQIHWDEAFLALAGQEILENLKSADDE